MVMSRKLNRILSMVGRVLSISFLVSLMISLSFGQSLTAKTRLVIGHYFTPGSFQADALYNLMRDFIEEFQALHPDIEVVHQPYDYAELTSGKMVIRLMNKLAPNVWLIPHVYLLNFADQGFLLDITDRISQAEWVRKDFIPQVLRANADPKGRIWGFPQGLQLMGLYYNTQLFDEGGVTYPNANWTWDDYNAVARKLLRIGSDGKPSVYGATVSLTFPYTGWSIFRSLGGQYFDETGTRSTLDSLEMQRAVEYMASGVRQRYFLLSSNSLAGSPRVAMCPDQYVRIPVLKQADIPFDVTAIPKGPKGRFTPTVANSWVITKDAPHDSQEAAWEWIKYYSSVPVQKRWGLHGDAAPPNMTAAKEIFLSKEASPKGIKDFIVGIQYADWLGANPVWGQWRGAWAPILEKAVKGEMDIGQAVSQANHAAQVVLDEYYKKKGK